VRKGAYVVILLFSLRDNFVTLQMVHNISLDKSSQSTFTKAVKNIQALIKVNMFNCNSG
jgi:hypothetical protein